MTEKAAGLQRVLAAAPRLLFLEILIGGFSIEIITLAVPIFSMLIFDKVIVHNSFATLHVIALGMLAVTLFEALLIYFNALNMHRFAAAMDELMTLPVLHKLMSLPLRYFEARTPREIAVIRQILSAVSIMGVIDTLFMIVVLLLLAVYSPVLAGVVLISVPILAVFSAILRPIVRSNQRSLEERQVQFDSSISEGLNSITTIKTMALESAWRERWSSAHHAFIETGLHTRRSAALEETVLRVLQRLVVLAVLWIGAMQVLANALSLGELIACYMFALRVVAPSTRLFQIVMGLFRVEEARKQLETLSAQLPEGAESREAVPFAPGVIRFEDVSFRYAAGQPSVIDGVNLTIPQGAFVAIVGPSGSGKSTLARLMQRHLTPERGRITINATDLGQMDLQELRHRVLLVTHDSALFQGTVRENIAGRGGPVDEQRLKLCCRQAEAAEFLASLKNGLDTRLTEKAVDLSSGQRQRLALARALYLEPQVLILDEATSALDSEAESNVLRNLRKEMAGRTLMAISHREQTLADADLLVRVHDAKVTATSRSSELLVEGRRQ